MHCCTASKVLCQGLSKLSGFRWDCKTDRFLLSSLKLKQVLSNKRAARCEPVSLTCLPVSGRFKRCMATYATFALNSTDLTTEAATAVQAVRLASILCKQVQLQLSNEEKAIKEDDSPVTVADYGAQVLVAWVLQRAFPGEKLSIVAEEDSADLRAASGQSMRARITQLVNHVIATTTPGAPPITQDQMMDLVDLGQSAGGAHGRHWVLDPIDGTRGFVGLRQYAVCLGMMQEGQVLLGVLGCPNLPLQATLAQDEGSALCVEELESGQRGVLFMGIRGEGAFMGPLLGEGLPSERLQVADSQELGELRYMESYESRHSDQSFSAQLAHAVGLNDKPLRLDSQVKYGALSRGDAAVYMRFPPSSYREKIWDVCAGAVIVEEAGVRVSDASGQPLDFSKGRWLDMDRGIVAATPTAHKALLEALKLMPTN